MTSETQGSKSSLESPEAPKRWIYPLWYRCAAICCFWCFFLLGVLGLLGVIIFADLRNSKEILTAVALVVFVLLVSRSVLHGLALSEDSLSVWRAWPGWRETMAWGRRTFTRGC